MGRLFAFVISLVVIGAALFFATRIAIRHVPRPDKPAMPVIPRGRAPSQPADDEMLWRPIADVDAVSTWRRIRSATVLLVLLTALGAFAALVLVILGAVLLSGLRSAVQ